MEEPSLAPAWLRLSFNKELPASSQDKSPKPSNDRERPKRFGKQNSSYHLTHSSSTHSPSAASANWRNSDLNPRILNRSKSSPVFDLNLKVNPETPKSPDRSNVPPPSERNFPVRTSPIKHKLHKPPLFSSRSQPNLFTMDKTSFQHQKVPGTRSPPSSRSSSFSSSAPPTSGLAVSTTPSALVAPNASDASQNDDSPIVVDPEMEKLRSLVPTPSVAPLPKPPSRLVNNRKSAHVSTKLPDRPKKPALPIAAQLRKASSESNLLHTPVISDETLRKMRALKVEKVKNMKNSVEEKDKVITKRNNFFMDVMKIEKQAPNQDSSEEETDGAIVNGHEVDEAKSEADARAASSEDEAYPPDESHRLSPNVEDEEKFLRAMGWVPDEEDHVPELDDSEIEEVRLKLNRQGSQGSAPSSPLRNTYTVGLRSLEMRT